MRSRSFSSLWYSASIYVIATGVMAYLRLYLYSDRFIALTYGLPLLICLWHRDLRLLWLMGVTFSTMSAYKAFFLLPESGMSATWSAVQWVLQVVNIVAIGGAVHAIVVLLEKLKASNRELQRSAEEIAAKNEELAHQNEEIQAQAEELAQHNEEIQQQSEELQQNNEELRTQGDELQSLNDELNDRESMLQALLAATAGPTDEQALLRRVCDALLDLFGANIAGAAIVEQEGGSLVVRAHAGLTGLATDRWDFSHSFAAIVMAERRTAFVDDLELRPDLMVVQPREGRVRSILAAPIFVSDKPIGAAEVYTLAPREYTRKQFSIIEWVAAQASLILQSARLQEERRRAEQALHQAKADLEREVEKRTAKLQEAVAELEHFSYTITHDMRAPLRAMKGYGDVLMQEAQAALTPAHNDYLRRIIRAADRMDALIRDALNYSKVVREQIDLSPVNTDALLRDVVESYGFHPPHLQVTIDGALPPVIANEAGLTQCFSNLLNNAVKFVRPGEAPHVRVWAENGSADVTLWFEDNGIGIADEFQERIFGMFQRLNKGYDGTGIGLALVRKVAERMKGRVGVKSEPGKGSRFWLRLPGAAELKR